MLLSILAAATLGLAPQAAPDPAFVPLPRAHAHNDYMKPRPLAAALEEGFGSIEADIFLVDGQLLVGHDRKDLRPNRTLKTMYLEPLAKRVAANKGSVYGPGTAPLILLIDIKEDGEKVYAALKPLLENYKEMFTYYKEPDGVTTRAVTAILSGDRPVATVTKEKERMVFIDGRPEDLEPNATDAELIPLISTDWTETFKWRGQGRMPLAEEAKLRLIVSRAHAQKQKLRFWASPENAAVWNMLYRTGVDLIGTDLYPGLGKFLRTELAKPKQIL
jgi:hypothetical protein